MPPAPRRLLSWSIAALALAAVQAPVLAQYTWRDARGQLHASDQPPPRDVADKDIIRRPATRPAAATPGAAASGAASAPPARSAAASAPVDPELQQRRARAEQEAKAKAQAEEQRLAGQRAENCQRARAHLATLDSGTRLVRVDARGERVVLDDAARAREAAEARGVIASECR
ncbi:MAG TPA: DUF4124 domain-containing protein [Aquabacterium sp.]|nr:DUF4124 domain-containing protein [Aquabacterium sp.]HQC96328.1 DUF4124 domain-containing protein [Aquabacterium sp.]